MIDLETLIRERQDFLRGRKLNWRDHLAMWWTNIDWDDVALRGLFILLLADAVASLLVIILLALFATPAHARWKAAYADSPNATWFQEQKDCEGKSCCGQGDAEPYYGGYSDAPGGSVTLESGVTINKCQVLEGPNKAGHALIWHNGRTIYCFSRGPEF